MVQGGHPGLSYTQKNELWRRWKEGPRRVCIPEKIRASSHTLKERLVTQPLRLRRQTQA